MTMNEIAARIKTVGIPDRISDKMVISKSMIRWTKSEQGADNGVSYR